MSTPRNRPSMRYFKIFVKDSGRATINLLEYVNDNIDIINEMGVKVKIAKITAEDRTPEFVRALESKGILRFPALVTDENKVKHGVKKIQSLFEGNKQSYQQYLVDRQPPTKEKIFLQDFAEDPLLANYYQKEMNLDALQRDKGKGDAEGFEGGITDDFNRRVNEQLTKRHLNSAPGGNTRDFDMQSMMARRQNSTPTPKNPEKHIRRSIPKEADNISTHDSISKTRQRTPAPPAAPTNGQFDDSMFDRAFMEGIGGDYY